MKFKSKTAKKMLNRWANDFDGFDMLGIVVFDMLFPPALRVATRKAAAGDVLSASEVILIEKFAISLDDELSAEAVPVLNEINGVLSDKEVIN